MTSATPPPVGHLFGATGRHVRVVVMTVTNKEFPVARGTFGACGELVELDGEGVYTAAAYADTPYAPFALVRAGDRGNLAMTLDVEHLVREYRPQAFLLVGTAGGICRPTNIRRTQWDGPNRGDVLISEFVHFGDYRKVTPHGDLPRHHRLEQPATHLLRHARALMEDAGRWHRFLGAEWCGAGQPPDAREVEILAGEGLQDDPLAAAQQFLMRYFDRAGAVEMESAGLAQALHSLRDTATYAPLFLSIRGVSDLVWARDLSGELTEDDIAKAKRFDRKRLRSRAPSKDKSAERDQWSPKAAAAASAFALGMIVRLSGMAVAAMPGHPAIPAVELVSAPTASLGA